MPLYANDAAEARDIEQFYNHLSVVYGIKTMDNHFQTALHATYDTAINNALRSLNLIDFNDPVLSELTQDFLKELLKEVVNQTVFNKDAIDLQGVAKSAIDSVKKYVKKEAAGLTVAALDIPKTGISNLDSATHNFVNGVVERTYSLHLNPLDVKNVAEHTNALINYTDSVGSTISKMLKDSKKKLKELSETKDKNKFIFDCSKKTALGMTTDDIENRIKALEKEIDQLQEEYDIWFDKWPSTKKVEKKLMELGSKIDKLTIAAIKMYDLKDKLRDVCD